MEDDHTQEEVQEEEQHHKDDEQLDESEQSQINSTNQDLAEEDQEKPPTPAINATTMAPNTEKKNDILLSSAESSTTSRSHSKKSMTPLPAERLSGLDTFFCVIERPENLMNIAGLWEFKAALDLQKVREELELMVERFPRFRQRIDRKPFGSIWFEDYDFNLDDHIIVEDLPENCDQEAYRQEISRIASLSLDESKVTTSYDNKESIAYSRVIRLVLGIVASSCLKWLRKRRWNDRFCSFDSVTSC